MIHSLNGQTVLPEQTLDGLYIGMRQGAYYEAKYKEQRKILQMYDSLVDSQSARLARSATREEGYLMVIDTINKAWDLDKAIGKNEVKIAKKKGNRVLKIVTPIVFVGGLFLGVATSN